ncbi:MAG: Flp pilus assembly complex ATPase component TadA [Planctomycetales bacterium]|nr:Flp pilus assembly complex ATPase component TadA [Planctomycetales bacterium]
MDTDQDKRNLDLPASAKEYLTKAEDQTVDWKIEDGKLDGIEPIDLPESLNDYLRLLQSSQRPVVGRKEAGGRHVKAQEAVDDKVSISIEKPKQATGDNTGNKNTAVAEKRSVLARMSACTCYSGEYLSATFRIGKSPIQEQTGTSLKEWEPGKKHDPTQFLLSGTEIADVVRNELDTPIAKSTDIKPLPDGLLVISGATNTSKSIVATALALRAVQVAAWRADEDPKLRRPHLVTYEDPIEKWEIRDAGQAQEKNIERPDETLEYGFTATLRDKRRDRTNLELALKDALRQTPAVMYVGEVREADEWKQIISFAGTGHLVVTTAHAASLSEAMSRIITAAEADTPAKRREVASRILACIHLRKVDDVRSRKSSNKSVSLIAPTMWHRKPLSISSLVATGLSSVHANGSFVLGRKMFFEKVAQALKSGRKQDIEEFLQSARSELTTMDLEELCE